MLNKKLMVLGLDGATWDVLLPLVKEGKMPKLEYLMKNGAWSDLISTIPPVTGPSWTSFATGKNPGKTGVFDFLVKEPGKYALKPVSSKYLKNGSVWDLLSKTGFKVGVVAFPMLYPTYPVNGFMISGVGAPSENKMFSPPSLKDEINMEIGDYGTSVGYHDPKYDDEELFLSDLNNFVQNQTKIVKYLLLNKNWDFFLYVFSATDWIQHLMWKHIDEKHPLYEPARSPSLKNRFIEFFQNIDSFIADVHKIIGDETNLMIVSDHGFGAQDQCFNLAKWLRDKNYIKANLDLKIDAKKGSLNVLTSIYKILKLKNRLPDKIIHSVHNKLNTSIGDSIDFNKSRAYCLGHTIPFGAIYINMKRRDPEGIVDPNNYDEVKNKIINELQKLPMELGMNLDVKVYDTQKIYDKLIIKSAPDIIFTINNYRCIITENNFNGPLFEEKPFSKRHTGSHRLNGIFLAHGPNIKKGVKIKDTRIIDVAPTILHMFHSPIPDNMDGRIVKEILKNNIVN